MERPDSTRQSVLFRFAHFWLLVGKSFVRNRCPVRASALAYTTLLALVPLLAVGVSIATGVLQKEGGQTIRGLIDDVVKNVAPALDLQSAEGGAATNNRNEVVAKITAFIDNIQSGALGVTSTVALVFVAIGLLRTIEAAFNDIWGVTAGRGWIASVVQYWATITLGPVILVVVLGLTTGVQFQRLIDTFRSSDLGAGDIKELPSLAAKITQKSDPLSEYIAGQLETPLLADLATLTTNMSRGVKPDPQLELKLRNHLNKIIDGVSIYDEKRFATITVRPEIMALVEEKPEGRPLARLNRRLLEEAYPEIKSRAPAFYESFIFRVLPFL
ncbi:MAG TPA: YhjD/YihY/BrkB family envelope integrity protein, partial [Verrucomicrobiae bacterium]|nr:YhjD/YihY/BrkB family envelope integrity protein [Verrucomicrobiae bacterium]